MKTITFYNDTHIVGGHEILAIEAAKSLTRVYKVIFICSSTNHDLQAILKETPEIRLITIPYSSNRLQTIRNFLSFSAKKNLYNIIKGTHTDLCILVQGNIELSHIAVYATIKAQIPCLSYIPLTQPLKRTSKNKILGLCKDFLHKRFYALPDAFITISTSLKDNILHIEPEKEVYIIHNKIDLSRLEKRNKKEARDSLGLPIDKYIIGYVGRIEAWHKGLDLYLKYLSTYASTFSDILFLFVGKGPYQSVLDKIKKSNPNVQQISWTNDLSNIYSSMDCMILPSRYEGVSLCMLEGMAYRLPMIASAIPEFEEYIPKENLFDLGNFCKMTDCINKALNRKLKFAPIPSFLKSPNHFENDFIDAIDHFITKQ